MRVLSWGGIGDALLMTPSFKAIKEQYPGCELSVLCTHPLHKESFENNPYIDKLVNLMSSPWQSICTMLHLFSVRRAPYGMLRPSRFYTQHASEIIADLLEIKLGERKPEIFLSEEEMEMAKGFLKNIPNPVTIHITSSCSANQNWPKGNWEDLVRSMPEYTFIQLGSAREEKVEGAMDLRGKTTLRESYALIKYSRSFAGVISSMAHATAAFDVPGVVLFGASLPAIWGHDNNINIYKGIPCAPCIDVLGGSACPYDKECMRKITVEEVRSALLEQVLKQKVNPVLTGAPER